MLETDRNLALERAVEVLRAGGVIAFPTDTVYGIGAIVSRPDAAEKIYRIKDRPADKPLQVLVADVSQISGMVREMPEVGRRLAEHFLPGGLTLILWRNAAVPDAIVCGGDTVAV